VQLPVIIYGANVVGIALSMLGFLRYASRNGFLVAEGSEEELVKRNHVTMEGRLAGLRLGDLALVRQHGDQPRNLRLRPDLSSPPKRLGVQALWERSGKEGLNLVASLYIYMDSR
jgi:hypothetical protein